MGAEGHLGENVLGEEVQQVHLMGSLICAGGIWRPALTTLFLWSAFKGGFRGGASERGKESRGIWVDDRTVLVSESVPSVCGIHYYHLPGNPS